MHLVEDIEVTKTDRLHAVGAGEDVVVEFVGQFGGCERGRAASRFYFHLWQVWVAAIGGATGSADGAFDASIAGGMSMFRKLPMLLWLVAMMSVNFSKGLSCFPSLSRFAAAASRVFKQTNKFPGLRPIVGSRHGCRPAVRPRRHASCVDATVVSRPRTQYPKAEFRSTRFVAPGVAVTSG